MPGFVNSCLPSRGKRLDLLRHLLSAAKAKSGRSAGWPISWRKAPGMAGVCRSISPIRNSWWRPRHRLNLLHDTCLRRLRSLYDFRDSSWIEPPFDDNPFIPVPVFIPFPPQLPFFTLGGVVKWLKGRRRCLCAQNQYLIFPNIPYCLT